MTYAINNDNMGKRKYKKYKIKILRQMGICLTECDLSQLARLRTEIEVDQWGRRIIMERLDDAVLICAEQ